LQLYVTLVKRRKLSPINRLQSYSVQFNTLHCVIYFKTNFFTVVFTTKLQTVLQTYNILRL